MIKKESKENNKNFYSKLNVPDIIIKVSFVFLILSVIYIIINLFNNIINNDDLNPYKIFNIFLYDMRNIIFSLTFWGLGIIFKKINERNDEK